MDENLNDYWWLKTVIIISLLALFFGILLGNVSYPNEFKCPNGQSCISDGGQTYYYTATISPVNRQQALQAAKIAKVKIILVSDWNRDNSTDLMLFVEVDGMRQFWDIYGQTEPPPTSIPKRQSGDGA
jgi:hypothetical protein